MTSSQVVETSVTAISTSFQGYTHTDDHIKQTLLRISSTNHWGKEAGTLMKCGFFFLFVSMVLEILTFMTTLKPVNYGMRPYVTLDIM